MYCPKCQTENADNAQVCQSCGASLTVTATQAAVPTKNSGLAIASLVLGICGFPTLGLTAVVGLILGIVALGKIQKSEMKLSGKGLAIGGIVISAITLIIMIILSMIIPLFYSKVSNQVDLARVTTTKANLKVLHNTVNQFKMDTGRYPAEDEGLMVLIEQPGDITYWQPGGYLETTEIPKDGWGNDFIYESFPEDGKPFVIKSFGADGEEGGEGINADLLSTNLR